MFSQKELTVLLNKIREKSHPKLMYLFGSYAYGAPTENSDIDILIVKKELQNKRKELIELKSDLISKDYSLDILLYSFDEYQQKKREGWKIFQDIEQNGKLFYAE